MRKTTVLFSAVLLSAVLTSAQAQWVRMDSLGGGTVYAFAAMGDNLFVATEGGGVFRSTDSGANWTAMNTGLPNLYIYALSLAASGSTLFAGSGSILGGGGVSRSTDSGATWTPVNNGLTNRNVFSLALIGGNLFAATGGGIPLR